MERTDALRIEKVAGARHGEVAGVLARAWSGDAVVSRGRRHVLRELAVLAAWRDGELVGACSYRHSSADVEVITLDAFTPGTGVGSALLAAAFEQVPAGGRLFLVTTNDNVDALAFYLRRGMRLVAVHRDAVEQARRIKETIPRRAANGLAIEDELELELWVRPLPARSGR
jgi:ribosomal protein S18 acetylase RimI-like enzyme